MLTHIKKNTMQLPVLPTSERQIPYFVPKLLYLIGIYRKKIQFFTQSFQTTVIIYYTYLNYT